MGDRRRRPTVGIAGRFRDGKALVDPAAQLIAGGDDYGGKSFFDNLPRGLAGNRRAARWHARNRGTRQEEEAEERCARYQVKSNHPQRGNHSYGIESHMISKIRQQSVEGFPKGCGDRQRTEPLWGDPFLTICGRLRFGFMDF